MAQREELMVTIKPDGSVVVDVVGAKGSACRKLVEPLQAVLGVVTSEDKKPEYYQPVSTDAGVTTRRQ
jgi:hypothetical protein